MTPMTCGSLAPVARGALLLIVLAACTEPPAPPVEEEAAEGWVMSRPFPEVRSLQSVEVLAPRLAYAVGTDLTLLRYEEGLWSREAPPEDLDPTLTLESVSGLHDEEAGLELIFAVGEGGAFVVRDDTGWQIINTPTDAYLFGVWARRPDDVFAVGERGTVLRWQGGPDAVQMVDETSEERFVVTAECDPADDDPESLLNPSFACQSADGQPPLDCAPPPEDAPPAPNTGNRCQGLRLFPIEEALKSVRGRGADDVFAVGERGSVFHFDGVRWLREDAGTNRPLSHVFIGGGVWATATDGVILRRNDVDNWDDTEFRVPVPLFLQSLYAINRGDVYAVGMSGRIFENRSGEWEDRVIDEDVHLRGIDGVFFDVEDPATGEIERARFLWAVGGGGRILRGPDVIPGDDGSNEGDLDEVDEVDEEG